MVSLRFLSVTATVLLSSSVWANTVQERRPSSHVGEKVFDWTVTWEDYAPDGYERKMLLVNGQSPGPELVINEGDTVVVHLHNASPQNTSLHFHGTVALPISSPSRTVGFFF